MKGTRSSLVLVYANKSEMRALKSIVGNCQNGAFSLQRTDAPYSDWSGRAFFGYCNLSCSFKACTDKFYALKSRMPDPIFILRPIKVRLPKFLGNSFVASPMSGENKQGTDLNQTVELKKSPLYACSPGWHIHPGNPIYKIAKVQRIISEDHGNRHSLPDLAREVEWSAPWLSSIFNKCAGISLDKYNKRIRFCSALWDIVATDAQIKRISSNVGYNDPLYFSKAFKKHFGYWPSQARKHGIDKCSSNRRSKIGIK